MEIENKTSLNLSANDFQDIDDFVYAIFRNFGGSSIDNKNRLVALHKVIDNLVQKAFKLGLSYNDNSAFPIDEIAQAILDKFTSTPKEHIFGYSDAIYCAGAVRTPTESTANSECPVCADYKEYPHLHDAIEELKDFLSKNMVKIVGYGDEQKQVKVNSIDKFKSTSELFDIPVVILERYVSKKPEMPGGNNEQKNENT